MNQQDIISEIGEDNLDLLVMTTQIVAATIGKVPMSKDEIPDFIGTIHSTLKNLSGLGVKATPSPQQEPAVNPKKSVQEDFIICLEDGKKFKSLKRHLSVHYGLTPEEYRAKWGLPADYPMVAPNYAAQRSELAKSMGLGRKKAA